MPMATRTLSLSALFCKAWSCAFQGSRLFGGRAVQYIGGALKQAWNEAKTLAAETAAQRQRGWIPERGATG